jgi:5'-phosphate synthase pdxT subunit
VSATVGVLALQGDFAAHAAALGRVGAASLEVRHPGDLSGLAGLVLPGGESTSMLRLMEGGAWFEALRLFAEGGGALFGTCAGAILLATRVVPAQACLGLLDVDVERNAYGRQRDSFEADLASALASPLRGTFIRAPRFQRLGPGVETLAELDGEPVLVEQGRVMAATFHPELAGAGVSPVYASFLRLSLGVTPV